MNSFAEEELEVVEGVKKALDEETASIRVCFTLLLMNSFEQADKSSLTRSLKKASREAVGF